ncbi:unnamed protein product [Danaus chrysippus]|uniref:(African queen) hypothetical protein n=1 Tax=Danaus chrysippus TaxID=151541 RepID=A0A8J2QMK7_9NEOP|nr:unnamed protein product [Danaus chrysippus]
MADVQNVLYIKEWMTKEPHLPSDLDDFVITKFLHSCYGSLEKTKKCIDNFCSTRSRLSEIYTSRDPQSPNVHSALSLMIGGSYVCGNNEVIINKFDDPTLERFAFYDMLKALCMTMDYWIQYSPHLLDEHLLVVDMTNITMKIIPKLNIMYLRDFIVFLLQGLPVRVKRIVAVNAPSFYDKIFAFIKPVLPAEVCDIIHFYTDYESLHKIVDKKCLPIEYGGEGQSIYDQNKEWIQNIEKERKMYLNDNLWKADLKKKMKSSAQDNTMNGSFRTLQID